MSRDLRALARLLGGEISGSQILAPGPGHSPRDRSLCVRLSATAPDGFVIFSHANDDFAACRDFVRERLGLKREWRAPSTSTRPEPTREREINLEEEAAKALWLWRKRQPLEDVVKRYLLARAYRGPIPATLGFLAASRNHPPSMIAAFGRADEPEPGQVAISDSAVRGVHLTHLLPDGSDRIGKITIGRGSAGSPIILFPPNDLLGLAIVEGIEDGLSVYAATGLGVWAAGTAGRLPALADTVPAYVECVTVLGHDDPAGRKGATELAQRLRARGVETILKIMRTENERGQD
jgi:hypothetical protein